MNLLKNVYYFCLDQIYPNSCMLCKQFMENHDNSFCSVCRQKFNPIPKTDRRENLLISEGLDAAYSGWYYSDGIDDVIHSLKYNDRAKLGLELGRHLGQYLSPETFGKVDYLTDVPLHNVKFRDRGYNQAEWISKGVADIWQMPYKKHILKRNRFTVSQTTLNKEERKSNMANAFKSQVSVKNQSIVIVDDVLTTGSTMSACAMSLKQDGATHVYGLTVSTPTDQA